MDALGGKEALVIALRLKDWRRYEALQELRQAFEFLERHAAGSGLQEGRNEIAGEEVYALHLTVPLKREAECVWETHPGHIDVIYLAEGAEMIGYLPEGALGEVVSYDAEKDTAFYANQTGYSRVQLSERDTVCVFYPEDGHLPWCQVAGAGRVRKIVVKVASGPIR